MESNNDRIRRNLSMKGIAVPPTRPSQGSTGPRAPSMPETVHTAATTLPASMSVGGKGAQPRSASNAGAPPSIGTVTGRPVNSTVRAAPVMRSAPEYTPLPPAASQQPLIPLALNPIPGIDRVPAAGAPAPLYVTPTQFQQIQMFLRNSGGPGHTQASHADPPGRVPLNLSLHQQQPQQHMQGMAAQHARIQALLQSQQHGLYRPGQGQIPYSHSVHHPQMQHPIGPLPPHMLDHQPMAPRGMIPLGRPVPLGVMPTSRSRSSGARSVPEDVKGKESAGSSESNGTAVSPEEVAAAIVSAPTSSAAAANSPQKASQSALARLPLDYPMATSIVSAGLGGGIFRFPA
jgi:hypothetical protein